MQNLRPIRLRGWRGVASAKQGVTYDLSRHSDCFDLASCSSATYLTKLFLPRGVFRASRAPLSFQVGALDEKFRHAASNNTENHPRFQ